MILILLLTLTPACTAGTSLNDEPVQLEPTQPGLWPLEDIPWIGLPVEILHRLYGGWHYFAFGTSL